MDDPTALERYAATRDPDAFRLLVERHIDLVYAAARRQLGNGTLAEDAAQAVFILLSQRAGRLGRSTPLVGWLLRTTYFVCRDARKLEARRRFHESKASAMHQNNPAESTDAEWETIRPHLDQALLGLGSVDRSALALRYFEDRSLRDVGEALGISDDAARKRIDRALKLLRKTLHKKGIIAPAALGTLLTAKAVEAAPSTLAASILAPATATIGTAATLAASTARAFLFAQFKLTAAATAILLIATTIIINVSANRPPPTPIAVAPVSAPAPAVAHSPESIQISYRGQLLDPAGKPVPNAGIRVYDQSFPARLISQSQTTADGSFAFSSQPLDPPHSNRVVVFDAHPYALTWWWPKALDQIADAPIRITLLRPSPVSGTVVDMQGHPVPDAILEATISPLVGGAFDFNAHTGSAISSDAQGRFSFDRMPEGMRMHLTVHHPDYCTWSTQIDEPRYYPIAAGTDDVEVQLQSDPATLGVQLMQNGKPLASPGISIVATLPHGQTQTQLTSDTGYAQFTGLEAGKWTLKNTFLNTSSISALIAVSDIALAPREKKALSIDVGTTIHGTLLEGNFNHPAQSDVTVVSDDGRKRLAQLIPDAAGHFEWLAPPGKYQFRANSYENGGGTWARQELTVIRADAEAKVMLTIHDWPIFQGRLIDAQGHPRTGVVVIPQDNYEQEGPQANVAFAGVDGGFTLSLTPRIDPTGSPPFAFAIDSSHRLGLGFTIPKTLPEGNGTELILQPMAEIVGTVIDRTGRPAVDARLGLLMHDELYTVPDWISKGAIDATGAFRIGPVPVGFNKLQLYMQTRDEWATQKLEPIQTGETRDLGQIILHPDVLTRPAQAWDATITGRIFDQAGKPVVGAALSVHVPSDGNGSTTILPESYRGATDLKGRFSISRLPRDRAVRLTAIFRNSESSWKLAAGADPIELTLPK